MTKLFDAPPIFELPVSKGDDLYFTFVYKPLVVDGNGDPILDGNGNKQYVIDDYPAGATVALTIDTDTPIVVDATISDSEATLWEQSEVADTITTGKLWRVIITFSDGRDKVLCNGTALRSDGKQPR